MRTERHSWVTFTASTVLPCSHLERRPLDSEAIYPSSRVQCVGRERPTGESQGSPANNLVTDARNRAWFEYTATLATGPSPGSAQGWPVAHARPQGDVPAVLLS